MIVYAAAGFKSWPRSESVFRSWSRSESIFDPRPWSRSDTRSILTSESCAASESAYWSIVEHNEVYV